MITVEKGVGRSAESVYQSLAELSEMWDLLARLFLALERDVPGVLIRELQRDVRLLFENQVKITNVLVRHMKGLDVVVAPRIVGIGGGADIQNILNDMTPTELRVLKLLCAGPNSAPQIGTLLGRSREHVARLMNELFREGYVEREVDKIPYVYSLTRSMKDVVEARLGDSSASTP